MNRQKLLLILLLGLFVLALAYAFRATPRQTQVSEVASRRPASTRPAASAGPSASAAEPRVHLELLVREDDASLGFKRNIFRFRQPAPSPLPPPPSSTVVLPPPPPPPVFEAAMPAAAARQRELARFTFLGFLLKDGVKSIFLAAGDEIFVVKKGDRFGKDRSFFVADLTPERLIIRQNDDPRPIAVSLVEQAPLVESPSLSPSQGPPGRGGPTHRRWPPLPERPGEDLRPAEPAPPFEPGAGEAVPLEQPPAEQTPPPQDAAPSEDPND
jgi:hypothetical protein